MNSSLRPPHRLATALLVAVALSALGACTDGSPRVEGATPTEVASATTDGASETTATSTSVGDDSQASSPSSPDDSTPLGSTGSSLSGGSGSSGTGSSGTKTSTPGGGSTSNTAAPGGTPTTANSTPTSPAPKPTTPTTQVRNFSAAYGSTPPVFSAHLGDEIVLTITSAEDQEFHVHPPYDIVLSGTKVQFDFTADQLGTKIVVESHTHPGVVVCYLTIIA